MSCVIHEWPQLVGPARPLVCYFTLLVRVSFYLEELLVEFVRFVSCILTSLLIPLCRSLIIRW